MSDDESDFFLKIVLIGDSNVGKTNLLSRFNLNLYDERCRNTIGVDFVAKTLIVKGKKVKAQFWDTAGQEKYRAIGSTYYKNAHGAILVYDLTKRDSFDNIDNWLAEVRQHDNKKMKILLIGNKNDLSAERTVPSTDGAEAARVRGLYFMETSAKTNENDCVKAAFDIILGEILDMVELEEKEMGEAEIDSLKRKVLSSKVEIDDTQQKKCC